MILTCPECSTKYMAKDGSIGPNGRSVCCARCEAVWYAGGTDPDVLALEDNKTNLIAPETESESNIESKLESRITPDHPALKPELASQVEASRSETTSRFIPAAPTIGAHTLLRDKADGEKLAKRKSLIRLIWAVPLCLLVGGATGAVLKRQSIVEQHPKTSTLYQALGMHVKANGLDIKGLSSERLVVDGDSILRVTGEVLNLTSQAKISPLIQFRLENRSGEALADWFVEPGTVPAGQSIRVETDYPAPPIDSIGLRYRFAPDE